MLMLHTKLLCVNGLDLRKTALAVLCFLAVLLVLSLSARLARTILHNS